MRLTDGELEDLIFLVKTCRDSDHPKTASWQDRLENLAEKLVKETEMRSAKSELSRWYNLRRWFP